MRGAFHTECRLFNANLFNQDYHMSGHQCCLHGSLNIKPGTSEDTIARALAPLLNANGMRFDHELASGAIEYLPDYHQLKLSLEFQDTADGRLSSGIQANVDSLGRLVDGHGYLELVDYDTAESESMIVPLFIGESLREQNRARVGYATDQAIQWLRPLLHANALSSIRDYIASFEPAGEPAFRLPTGSPAPTEPAILARDVLASTTGFTIEQIDLMVQETGLSGEALDAIYNPGGDGEHPAITRVMWREAVANQETVSGYWDWAAYQIAEATGPALW
ncbi:hypothetical protein HDG34_003186 [Paraburkholderia sp. HC6.4b]|uniref:hypothetical protein n=1 Tax=unclassified Paraburkholderia TaxID=2615204 RepID=UPI001620307D|nr:MULTISPECIES: hypothetical protein [unclassified Paraburkholderia]MBB5409245.1 hypothetical protein [Paraburkholderia sp. HC6.4b]MBB5450973.1 hypothetical protein [Paraburkholderia sp. Kb1A]